MTTSHRITWYVYQNGHKVPRTAAMRGLWYYDVTCTCGWETTTGGATKHKTMQEIMFHKLSSPKEL